MRITLITSSALPDQQLPLSDSQAYILYAALYRLRYPIRCLYAEPLAKKWIPVERTDAWDECANRCKMDRKRYLQSSHTLTPQNAVRRSSVYAASLLWLLRFGGQAPIG